MNKKSTRIAKAEQYLLKCATPPLSPSTTKPIYGVPPEQIQNKHQEFYTKIGKREKTWKKIDATRYNRSANRNQKIPKSLKPRIKIGYPNSLQIAELHEIDNN